MSEREIQGLSRLNSDLEEATLLPPDLIARYVSDPNGLSPEERASVEHAMTQSPALADEIATLRHFDFTALDRDLAAQSAPGLIARIQTWLATSPASWVAVGFAAALALWFAAGSPTLPTPQTGNVESSPNLVEATPSSDPGREGQMPVPKAPAPSEIANVQSPSSPSETGSPNLAPQSPTRAPRTAPQGESPPPIELAEDLRSKTAPPNARPPDAIPSDRTPPNGEILLAMATPVYRPAFGLDAPGSDPWIVRGEASAPVQTAVVSPDHVTRISRANPTLHWALDRRPKDGDFYLTVLDDEDEPIALDIPLGRPKTPGLQRIPLADHGVQLPENRLLRWSIAWRADPEAPPASFDFGWLRRLDLDPSEKASLTSRSASDQAAAYAILGCFHEALDAALETWSAHPESDAAQQAVDELLDRVGEDVRQLAKAGR